MVWQAAQALKIPVIGAGGIHTAADAIEFLIAGASAVEIGTANFIKPSVTIDVLEGIQEYMARHQIKNMKDLIGSLMIG